MLKMETMDFMSLCSLGVIVRGAPRLRGGAHAGKGRRQLSLLLSIYFGKSVLGP